MFLFRTTPQKKPISFAFVLDKLTLEEPRIFWRLNEHDGGTRILSGVHFDVSIRRSGERTRISRILVRIDSPKVSYEIFVDEQSNLVSLKLNGTDISDLFKSIRLQVASDTLLPEISIIRDKKS